MYVCMYVCMYVYGTARCVCVCIYMNKYILYVQYMNFYSLTGII